MANGTTTVIDKDNNGWIDRGLGFIVTLLVFFGIFAIFSYPSFSWSWFRLVIFTIGLGIWDSAGLKKIEVGWRGQLLFLGQRMNYVMYEGWRWLPFPLGIKVADCREAIQKLDQLEVITFDNVKVTIDGSMVYSIINLNKYFGVEASGLKQGLDDVWDEVMRNQVVGLKLDEVLAMHKDIKAQAQDAIVRMADVITERWGIHIDRLVIASIAPDKKVMDDLELVRRENAQRDGQRVELQHFEDMVKKLMSPKPTGLGLSEVRAVEQVQLAIGNATKTIDERKYGLDPAVTELLAAYLAGRK